MAIDLKNLKPTKVTRDLKGKYVFIFGDAKAGKTTLACSFPKNILFATEKGYNCLSDIYAVDITSWADFKKAVKQLSDPEVQEMFNTVTIDTISLLADRCTEYICAREGVEKIGDVPFGQGFQMVDKELEKELRKITQYGLGLVLIGHSKTRVDSDGTSSVKHIVPDLGDRIAKIVNRMVDITAYIGSEDGTRYIYPRQTIIENGKERIEIFAGSRFANLNDRIPLGYDAFVEAIAHAMESNATATKTKLVDTPVEQVQEEVLDFKAIMGRIKVIAKALNSSDNPAHLDNYKKIVEEYLGAGKLVKECTESQVAQLDLILGDLEAYIKEQGLSI